jgi:deoxyribodipyrimidine photolyase-related protein
MGTWKKGPWQEVWDALFWRFMFMHQDFFNQNPRLSMLLRMFEKMPHEKRQGHLSIADNFLCGLDKQ